jgi:DNA repair photolyase
MHGCVYCYARFMKAYTGHKEPWGHFIDIKINAPKLIPKSIGKYKDKSILMSSVTDPYHPAEIKYKLTRKILEKLICLQPNLNILTKSGLVLRDIDLLKQFKKCLVTISLSILDEKIRRQLEPLAASAEKRIKALRQLHRAGLKTAIFISPILPRLTNWQAIINKTKLFIDEYWFENLNPYFSIQDNILRFLKKNNPELFAEYKKIWAGKSNYWNEEERRIKQFCRDSKVICKIYFHHKRKN